MQYDDFCPINILDDPYCLHFIYNNEHQRGKGHGRRVMNIIVKHFQTAINSLDSSLGFFEHMSAELGLEKLNTGLPFVIVLSYQT